MATSTAVGESDRDKDRLEEEERRKVLEIIASLYSEGYSDGMVQVANEYGLHNHIPSAGARMEGALQIRLDLIDQAMTRYTEMIQAKAAELATQGLDGNRLEVEVLRFARELADKKAEVIGKMEFAQARLDGAGNILDESGMQYEWRFPHFDIGRPGHEVCDICEAIAEGSPYTTEQAEAEGFPTVPHPECDHGWTIVPVGQRTLTEQYNNG